VQLVSRWPGVDPTALAYAVTYLEPLLQVPPRGLWRQSGQARWTTADTWLGRQADADTSDQLVSRYLAAFGPASVADLQAWSGLTGLGAVIEAQRARLRTFHDEQGRELFDLADAPLPDPGTPAPPRFLPAFDNAVLSHSDRRRIVAAPDRRLLNSDRLMRAFLVDGFVAGTWSLGADGLQIKPFRKLNADDRRALTEEAQKLLTFWIPEAPNADIRFAAPASAAPASPR
jgi:hypothetical protein